MGNECNIGRQELGVEVVDEACDRHIRLVAQRVDVGSRRLHPVPASTPPLQVVDRPDRCQATNGRVEPQLLARRWRAGVLAAHQQDPRSHIRSLHQDADSIWGLGLVEDEQLRARWVAAVEQL
jgi:hypothetical protein